MTEGHERGGGETRIQEFMRRHRTLACGVGILLVALGCLLVAAGIFALVTGVSIELWLQGFRSLCTKHGDRVEGVVRLVFGVTYVVLGVALLRHLRCQRAKE